MTIKINNEDLELVYSFRSAIFFEQISNKSLDLANLTGNDLVTLFFAVVTASLQKARKPVIDMLSFLDAIDDNGGERVLVDFANWYVSILKSQYDVLSNLEDEDKKKVEELKPGDKIKAGKKKKA